MLLTPEWKRLAGAYMRAADSVRAAERDVRVSNDAYGVLIDDRERAYADLETESRRTKIAP